MSVCDLALASREAYGVFFGRDLSTSKVWCDVDGFVGVFSEVATTSWVGNKTSFALDLLSPFLSFW